MKKIGLVACLLLLISCNNWKEEVASRGADAISATLLCKRVDVIREDILRLLGKDVTAQPQINDVRTCKVLLGIVVSNFLVQSVPEKWVCDLDVSVPKVVEALEPLCDLVVKESLIEQEG